MQTPNFQQFIDVDASMPRQQDLVLQQPQQTPVMKCEQCSYERELESFFIISLLNNQNETVTICQYPNCKQLKTINIIKVI